MGLWQHTAYLASEDLEAVERELEAICVVEGKRRVIPAPRRRDPLDPMQVGTAATSRRWGIAGFTGAPGWTVLKTAPLELLADEAQRLGQLCRRLGCQGFQLNVYDGDAERLVEHAADGRHAVSGLGLPSPDDPRRAAEGSPVEGSVAMRFSLIDVRDAAESARARAVGLVLVSIPAPTLKGHPATLAMREERRLAKRRWLATLGVPITDEGENVWPVSAADVVAALASDHPPTFGSETIGEAVNLVFAGKNAPHGDNAISSERLCAHQPLGVAPSFVVYVE